MENDQGLAVRRLPAELFPIVSGNGFEQVAINIAVEVVGRNDFWLLLENDSCLLFDASAP